MKNPFETAESIRIMKAALEKSGGKTYHNAVELQKAQERHKNYMKESLVVVVDNSKKEPNDNTDCICSGGLDLPDGSMFVKPCPVHKS